MSQSKAPLPAPEAAEAAIEAPAAPAAPVSWYRRLYLRVEALSQTPHAVAALVAVSVADASFFPVPPFALLVPMVLAAPKTWLRLAALGTFASILGGVIGYYIGLGFHDFAVNSLHIDLDVRPARFGINDANGDGIGDKTLGQLLGDEFWVLALLCSILPTPFKVVSIGSGLANVPLPSFLLAAAIGRTTRFLLVGGVMRFVGPQARKWLRV